MVEGQHVAAAAEREQGIGVGVVPDDQVGADQRGAVCRRGRKHPEPHAEADRGLAGHPRELARAHHAHYRGARAVLIVAHPP